MAAHCVRVAAPTSEDSQKATAGGASSAHMDAASDWARDSRTSVRAGGRLISLPRWIFERGFMRVLVSPVQGKNRRGLS